MSRAVRIFLPLEPVPASRPRVTRWRTFYEEPYNTWKDTAEAALSGLKLQPLDGPLQLRLEVLCTKPRTSKLDMPRPDVDNFAKAVMDALTKAQAWHDDKQVGRLIVDKWWAAKGEQAGIRIEITPREERKPY